MDTKIQLFDFKGQQVRTLLIDEEPYFVGKDVAEVLGYKDLSRAVNQHVDREDRKSLSRKDSGDSLRSLWTSDNDWTNKVVINDVETNNKNLEKQGIDGLLAISANRHPSNNIGKL